ncbi:Ribonuclease kappa-A [Fasciola gigantica]|uniref:Ribonuclease kappa-A n=1 Tax=Fasciola gigantica TaxID=46835 RepID=A0A504YSS1_FASGI|nr:Ribonuclease kappa-A [Fasciola gigantica]
MRVIGPKCSVFLLVMSVWGVLMLLLMGVFARVNAVSLAEDIPLNQAEWAKQNYSPQLVDDAYVMMSNNCFIAAGIYVIVLGFAGVQYYVNKRASPLVH